MLTQAFDEYVKNYDMSDEKIELKYRHSYRVMELNEKYARELGFPKEDIELARIIGLLHDLGRFEQLRVYHTFNDSKSVDHADYSVVQLFDKGEIKKFTDKEEDYEIIKFAIQNHNKFKLPECLDERMMRHAKLIRDSDKLDIIYLLGYLGELNQKAVDEPITKEIVEAIKNHEEISKSYIQNKNDHIALQFAFVFDINNDICLPEMRKNLGYFYKQVEANDTFKEVYEEILKYIEERMNNHVRNEI